jgi:alkaline phosphatase D
MEEWADVCKIWSWIWRSGLMSARSGHGCASMHKKALVSVLLTALLIPIRVRGQEAEDVPARILFGSCLDPRKSHPVLSSIIAAKPDLFIFLGDNVYADTGNRMVLTRRYRELGDSPLFRELLRVCPVMAVWDDHDYGKNDAGAEFSAKQMSREVFLEFWQVPDDSERRTHGGVYHSALFGPPEKRIQIILLDTRFFRSPLTRGRKATVREGPYVPVEGEDVTLLGEEQWRWLEEQLGAPARLRIIASSIQVLTEYHGWESWANFPRERERLLSLLKRKGAGGVVFISGDRHFGELSIFEQDDFYPLYDLTSSGLNRRFPARTPNSNRNRVGGYYLLENFGMIAVDWELQNPRIDLVLFDEEGNEVVRQELGLSTLSP